MICTHLFGSHSQLITVYPQIRAGEVYGGVDVGPPSGVFCWAR